MSLLDIQLQQQTLPEVMNANSSAVYGVVLNDKQSVDLISSQLDQPPYKAAPIAPVLYIKPKNTFALSQAAIKLPAKEQSVEIGATLALVIKNRVSKVSTQDALSCIAGIGLVADLSLPHDSYYRPAVREKCFDGALPIANTLIEINSLEQINLYTIDILVNNALVATRKFDSLVRNTDQLIFDVSDYMTLRAADILLLGVSYQAPQAQAGDSVQLILKDSNNETATELSFDIQAGDLS
jgi:5-oxopent-3-ene-1,2,5-tricarboxylate decarboxylase/2-hydroxyhepta-2,4-diene-1,7-dioate isomerase